MMNTKVITLSVAIEYMELLKAEDDNKRMYYAPLNQDAISPSQAEKRDAESILYLLLREKKLLYKLHPSGQRKDRDIVYILSKMTGVWLYHRAKITPYNTMPVLAKTGATYFPAIGCLNMSDVPTRVRQEMIIEARQQVQRNYPHVTTVDNLMEVSNNVQDAIDKERDMLEALRTNKRMVRIAHLSDWGLSYQLIAKILEHAWIKIEDKPYVPTYALPRQYAQMNRELN